MWPTIRQVVVFPTPPLREMKATLRQPVIGVLTCADELSLLLLGGARAKRHEPTREQVEPAPPAAGGHSVPGSASSVPR